MREPRPSTGPALKRAAPITLASFLFIILGVGLTISNPIILASIIFNGSAPVVFGISLLDGHSTIGMLWGRDAVISLGVGLTIVAVLGILAGVWLRGSRGKGGRLGFLLLPFYLFFGVGFEIPALYVFVPLTAIFLSLGWKTLR
jgi:hypothetical protein